MYLINANTPAAKTTFSKTILPYMYIETNQTADTASGYNPSKKATSYGAFVPDVRKQEK